MGRELTSAERFEIVFDASKEVRKALLFGQIIIMVVYLPVFALSGVEGKMFHPMAFTVLLALLGAVFLSVTFVPAAVAMFLSGKMMEKEGAAVLWAKKIYAPALDAAMNNKGLTVTIAVVIVALSLLLTTRMGSEFIPSLDEEDIALHAIRIPGTSLSTAIEMQNELEETIKKFPEVERVFSKIGTAEIATDPMPPSVADIFIIIKPQSEWSGKYRNKEELIAAMEQAVRKVPGNNYEFTQPIQMRFNELLSGVRADVAVKVFGDDLDIMLNLAERIEKIIKAVPGAADVRVEQITGLPVLSIQMDRAKMARYGLNGSDVQDAINIAVGGRTAGLVFEGDRRFELQVRLPEQLRGDIETLRRLPIKLPVLNMGWPECTSRRFAYLRCVRRSGRPRNCQRPQSNQPRKRQTPGGGDCKCAWPRHRFFRHGSGRTHRKADQNSSRILAVVGRAIRAVDHGGGALADCHPLGAWIGVFPAVHHAR